MKGSKIQWTTHTFNPWIGCTKVSPGCAHCYAEALDRRWGHGRWGAGAPRQRTSDAYWRQPLAWDRAARGSKPGAVRVFCASLADVWEDREDLVPMRADLFRLMEATPALTWLLLTKRPENMRRLWPRRTPGPERWPNVWLGATVEDQERAAQRVPQLVKVPAALRFLSVEPLLGPVDLRLDVWRPPAIGWCIVGGESGAGARPMDVAWARNVLEQCRAAGVPCFVKQLGRNPQQRYRKHVVLSGPPGVVHYSGEVPIVEQVTLKDPKGGNMEEWPADLRVRQVPELRP